MTQIAAGKAYTLRTGRGDYYLHPGNDHGGCRLQIDGAGGRADHKPSYQWHAFPADSDHKWWWLTNKAYGTMLYVEGDGDVGSHLCQAQILKPEHENFKWTFDPADDGWVRVRTLQSDLFMHSDRDHWVNIDSKCSDRSDQWFLQVVEEYPSITSLKPAATNPDFGEIDRLKGYKAPAEETKQVLVGSTAVPYFVVEEGDHGKEWKSQNSPYYILSRYSSWERHGFKEHDGHTAFSYTFKTEVGFVNSSSTEVEKTLNISVSAEGGFDFKGASAKIGGSVSRALSIKQSYTTTFSKTRTDEQTVTFPAGHRFAVAVWYRLDTYKLTRMNGDPVLTWYVRDPSSYISDGFPKLPDGKK